MRLLHRAPGRRLGLLVPRAGGAGRRRRGAHGRVARDGSLTRSRTPSFRPAPSSAASARRGCSSARRRSSSATPRRATTRSARRSRATSAAAPATRRCSTRCALAAAGGVARPAEAARIGESAVRIDGPAKVTGSYVYGSDLRADGMLFGATLRSPHAAARIARSRHDGRGRGARGRRGSDRGRRAGQEDVRPRVRRPAGARRGRRPLRGRGRGARRRRVARAARARLSRSSTSTTSRSGRLGRGGRAPAGRAARARVRQRPAPRPHRERRPRRGRGRRVGRGLLRDGDAGPGRARARGRARPPAGRRRRRPERRRRSGSTSTGSRSLRASTCRRRRCASTLAGVGGAFGSREDVHVQIHACLLALRTGRPVKMAYSREESFHGHVHRHPSRTWIRLRRDARRADRRGRGSPAPRRRRLRLLLARGARERRDLRRRAVRDRERAHRGDGRLHEQPAVRRDARVRRAAGLLRLRVRGRRVGGEARARSGRAPAAERRRDRLGAADGPGADRERARARGASSAALRSRCPSVPGRRRPAGRAASASRSGSRTSPTARASTTRRGDGDAARGARPLRARGECAPRPSTTARGSTRCSRRSCERSSASRTSSVAPATTYVGSAGSTSASRQTTMAGGAVQAACRAVRAELRGARRRPERADHVHARVPPPADRPGSTSDGHGDDPRDASRSSPSARSSTSTRSSASCASCRSRRRRTSAGRSTRRAPRARSRAATAMGLGLALMEERAASTTASSATRRSPTTWCRRSLDVPEIVTELVEVPEPGRAVRRQGHRRAADGRRDGRRRRRAPRGDRADAQPPVPVRPTTCVGLRPPAVSAGPPPVPDVAGPGSRSPSSLPGARPAGTDERR